VVQGIVVQGIKECGWPGSRSARRRTSGQVANQRAGGVRENWEGVRQMGAGQRLVGRRQVWVEGEYCGEECNG
jgi:hypothetical protein